MTPAERIASVRALVNDKNQNLLVRIATALLLVPVLFCVSQGGLVFALLIAFAAAAAARELHVMAVGPLDAGGVFGMAFAALFALSAFDATPALTPGGVASAAVIVLFVERLFAAEEADVTPELPRRVALAVLGCVYPGLLLSALVLLRERFGVWWVVLALTVTWTNDTGAYFAGRALGRHKMYPKISPAKTWEGAAGGLAASIAGALVVQHFWLSDSLSVAAASLIGAGAAVLGPLGDLSESMLKRSFGVKDSGALLPGHGGMLDRIDALLFVAPFVLACARVLATRQGP